MPVISKSNSEGPSKVSSFKKMDNLTGPSETDSNSTVGNSPPDYQVCHCKFLYIDHFEIQIQGMQISFVD